MTYEKVGRAALVLLLALLLILGCASVASQSRADSLENAEASVLPEAAGEYRTVQVSSVDELLDAIGPHREIVLAPGEYNLAKSSGYGRMGSEWYHWESSFDGYELVISDVTDMTIDGVDASRATINTEPRYSNVMRFDSVSGVTIRNLTAGHTEGEGNCTGGVLYFENSSELEVQNASLYGCGIRGVELNNCRNFHMDSSDIYKCSYGAVNLYGCYNVLFENSKFYDCHVYDGLFEIFGSREIAVINSEIFNNYDNYDEDWGSLISSNCYGIYLGGLDIHDNSLDTFNCVVPVTVENCRFQSYDINWKNASPVDIDGNQLTERDLMKMSMRRVTWEAKPLDGKVDAPEKSEDGKIHVTNVDEFLAAIASDTVIYLEPGVYGLPDANSYGCLGGEYYHWENSYDGPELVITDVTNLTIEGAGMEQVSIMAAPRYANVLRFDDVTGLTVRNLTAGHFEGPSQCAGGVIALNYANDTQIEGCSLFGCGILGVCADNCCGLTVKNTEIYDCSYGAAKFFASTEVSMDGCYVHDNGSPTYYADSDSQVQIDGMTLTSTFLMTDDSAINVKAPENAGNTEVHVASVDDFLAAIAPNTTIFLESGVYDLTQASDYGASGGSFYRWEETYDGYELVISGANGLTIDGAGKDHVQILTTPRYANVLRFENMNDLILKNVTAGHSDAPGECSGSVIYLEGIGGAKIENCGLFGCGVVGITGADSNNLYVYGTEIYECSYTSAVFYSCNFVRVARCDIHDNGCNEIYFQDCIDVAVDS